MMHYAEFACIVTLYGLLALVIAYLFDRLSDAFETYQATTIYVGICSILALIYGTGMLLEHRHPNLREAYAAALLCTTFIGFGAYYRHEIIDPFDESSPNTPQYL